MRGLLTVVTVGCKANFADSSSMVRDAVSAGYEIVPAGGAADVVIVNGCTVTHRADRDCRALVRRMRRGNPDAVIVLTGCYARTSPDPRSVLPEADHWVRGGPEELAVLLRRIREEDRGTSPAPSEYTACLLLGHRRTFLKIQDGCDSRCAYCIVPFARGNSRSDPEREVVARAAAAEADGARELVLTGIHVGAYGRDRGEKEGLARLVSALLAGTRRVRIRLSSIEPMESTERLLSGIAENPRVCPHLHVPLQSGSDRVLERMRRPYRAGEYAAAVERIARSIPGCQVGADVIAGFPGETEEDFEETFRLLEDLPVHYLHVFPYSPRKGTESGSWRDDVSPRAKKERVSRLLLLDEGKRTRYLQAQAGKVLEVLAESARPGGRELAGVTGNYLEAVFPGEEREIGELVRIRGTGSRGKEIIGTREDGNA